jgi:hypothetical protein
VVVAGRVSRNPPMGPGVGVGAGRGVTSSRGYGAVEVDLGGGTVGGRSSKGYGAGVLDVGGPRDDRRLGWGETEPSEMASIRGT